MGISQGRLKILRTEAFIWRPDDNVGTLEFCAIIHNILVELKVTGGLGDGLDSNGKSIPNEDVVTEFPDLPASKDGSAASGFLAPPVSEWMIFSAVGLIIRSNAVVTNKDTHLRLITALTAHFWPRKCNN